MSNVPAQLTQVIDSFVQYLEGKGRAKATMIAYRKDLEQMLHFLVEKGIMDLASVQPEHIEQFKEDLGEQKYTAKSISRKLNAVKSFFKFTEEKKLTAQNPAAAIAHPKYQIKAPRILNQMEYRSIRDASREDVRISTIIELLLQTGMRIGELARIELDNIKEDQLVIRSFESHPERKIPLNKAAKKALNDYLAQRPKTKTKSLFITKSGRPFLVRNIRSAIERYFKLAGISDAKVNDLRHTFIAHQLVSGNSVVLIQKIVGHKRLSTTEKYLDFIQDQPNGQIKIKEL